MRFLYRMSEKVPLVSVGSRVHIKVEVTVIVLYLRYGFELIPVGMYQRSRMLPEVFTYGTSPLPAQCSTLFVRVHRNFRTFFTVVRMPLG